nr:unnamed protein product [Digitaria exilis]
MVPLHGSHYLPSAFGASPALHQRPAAQPALRRRAAAEAGGEMPNMGRCGTAGEGDAINVRPWNAMREVGLGIVRDGLRWYAQYRLILKRLSNKIAWEGKQLAVDDEMKLPQSIVTKCGGLPKVLAAIGEVCSSDKRVLDSLSDNFIGTLETEPRFHSLRTLFSWMQSYFDACSDSIKPCIFYLSIFCADKNIRRQRLLWRWIAEGYCRDTFGVNYENGERFISELINLSIIQQQSPSKALCQINGFFHEYIFSRPMEDNLVFALEGRFRLSSLRTGQHHTVNSNWDRDRTVFESIGRHLIIKSNWDRDRTVFESINFSRLQSLTVSGKWMPFFISSKINIRLLRVLDLEDALDVTDRDLKQIGNLLPRLKYISLRGCTKVTCLPNSMGGLRHLQTLDIRHTSIVRLPLFITKLQKLLYIRAGKSEVWDWNEGDVLQADGEVPADTEGMASTEEVANLPAATACSRPRGWVSSLMPKLRRGGLDNSGVEIGKLSAFGLHTLGVVNVTGSCGKSIFKELKKLTQLRKLGVSGINKGNIKDFCYAISGHAHLKSLSVEFDNDDDLDGLDDIPQPPKTLSSLKLYGHVRTLLVWIDQLDNLKKLKLDLALVKPEELQGLPFSRLPYLVPLHHLRIRPIQDGELQIGNFSSRVVEIQCSSVLCVNFYRDIFSEIEVLKVHCSRGASLQISELRRLRRSLKEVWLKGYISEELKQSIQQQIDEMPLLEYQKRPVLKLVQACSS